ncbi:glycosyltransferase [Cytobacillus firmus]|uniref:glycosyltransferase family protein n=1 Tax=Cytobacillus firmus TaxID=1399 RepID=UPI00384AF6C8
MNDNNEFKNILVISNYSIFENSPLGITLRSIFKEWPENKVFEIYRHQTQDLNNNFSIKSLQLPLKCLPIYNLIRIIGNRKEKYVNTKTTFQISKNDKLSTKRKIKYLLKYFSESIFVMNKKSKAYEELVQFKPEVIYTVGESLFTLKASLFFSKKFNIPIVIHYMDNWRETLYPNRGILKFLNLLFSKNLNEVENRMKNGLVISPKMKEKYSLINQNVNYNVLLNSIDNVQNNKEKSNIEEDTVIFSYIGGLHLNRWESLLEIEKCIVELNKVGISSKLFIYTPNIDELQFLDKFNKKYTVFKGYLSHDKVSHAYNKASILVHIESFQKHVIRYTEYSLSTKIPECMSTGKPILCYAPKFLAVSDYINTTKSGIAVDNFNDLLKESINLAENRELRKELGQNGVLTANKNHTYDRALEILLETL